MNDSKPPLSESNRDEGVYFADSQYIGLLRRWGIIAIDSIVVLIALIGTLICAHAVDVNARLEQVAFLALIGIAWAYLVIPKHLGFGTLGYRVLGARIVDLKGNRPTLFRLTVRLLTTCFSVGNPILDMVWMEMDRSHQTLRDKLTGMYVVRKDALPSGTGPIRNSQLFVLGYTFIFQHVDARANASSISDFKTR